jgi:hypothetical protein
MLKQLIKLAKVGNMQVREELAKSPVRDRQELHLWYEWTLIAGLQR